MEARRFLELFEFGQALARKTAELFTTKESLLSLCLGESLGYH